MPARDLPSLRREVLQRLAANGFHAAVTDVSRRERAPSAETVYDHPFSPGTDCLKRHAEHSLGVRVSVQSRLQRRSVWAWIPGIFLYRAGTRSHRRERAISIVRAGGSREGMRNGCEGPGAGTRRVHKAEAA